MILNGGCYLVILFCRVILYTFGVAHPYSVGLLTSTLVYLHVLSSPDVYRRSVSSPHAPLIHHTVLYNLFKTLDLPFGEDVLTH